LEEFAQTRGDFGLGGVHTLIESLHHQVVTVAVHHEGRQQIGFAMRHSIGIGIVNHLPPVLLCGAQAAQIKIAADLFDLPREYS
jgi:hypothetical protein